MNQLVINNSILSTTHLCSEKWLETRPMTSCPASSVGRAADRCTEGRVRIPHRELTLSSTMSSHFFVLTFKPEYWVQPHILAVRTLYPNWNTKTSFLILFSYIKIQNTSKADRIIVLHMLEKMLFHVIVLCICVISCVISSVVCIIRWQHNVWGVHRRTITITKCHRDF